MIPGNPERGLDAHQGAVLLSDGETGELVAILNASPITAIRTAAVSAVATRALAREDARELAIIGAGVQARSHLLAMAAVRPFERARIWSRTAAHAERLAAEAGAPFPLEVAESAEAAVRDADVVVTATSARRAGAQARVARRGSARQRRRVVDSRRPESSTPRPSRPRRLFVDRRESTENESGDYLIAMREGAIGTGAHPRRARRGARGRRPRPDIRTGSSRCSSRSGIAIEDLAAAEYVVARARETGAGTEVAF